MRPQCRRRNLAALVLVTLVIANSTLFTVYQTDQALLVRLGEPLRVVTEPGLNFKIPFLFEWMKF